MALPSTAEVQAHLTRRTPKGAAKLGYRRIVTLLVTLIIVPTVLLLFVGIIMTFLGEAQANLLFGMLTITFVAALVTGVVLVLVFLRRAARLSELQADFVSKVSHELRTPLTSIRLFTETLERADGDQELQRKCIESLSKESMRLSVLIERLLDWGRMEAGRKIYDLRPETIATILEETTSAFAPERHPELQYELSCPADLPKVLADREALSDALGNLLSNGLKYGGSPCKIVVRARREDDEWVVVDVEDNGQGIAREEQKRVFQKFYRIDDRLARATEGSGLGLAIVEHVMRGHGGRVALSSTEGKGSTFSLYLQIAHS
jgi:two-component system, OmpR family, phosphate regulon sensor histidine kinase PhoR